MPWFRIDDSFYDHPKVFDAPDCALALWVRAGTWSARNLTDGFVPAGMPARLCDDPDTAVRELVRRGLWSRAKGGGYQFHDWSVYQPSRESVEDLRAKRAEAGRRGGMAKARNAAEQQEGGSKPSSNGLANASPVAKQNSTPARPDPTPSGDGGGLAHGGRPPPADEPPRECPDHIGDPDPPPCGACADARRRRERWDADQVRADQARRSQAAHQAADARRVAIGRCDQCDDRGYLPTGRTCQHRPISTTGAAAARAALAKPREER